jgi:hypothetical protein
MKEIGPGAYPLSIPLLQQLQGRRRGSRTSRALQAMFEAHRPSGWYFEHFHLNREFLIGEMKFHCVAEMAISLVSDVFSATQRIR